MQTGRGGQAKTQGLLPSSQLSGDLSQQTPLSAQDSTWGDLSSTWKSPGLFTALQAAVHCLGPKWPLPNATLFVHSRRVLSGSSGLC